MRKPIYAVKLAGTERTKLQEIVSSGKASARIIRRANMLLMLDENREKRINRTEIAALLNTSAVTVIKVARQYTQEGMESVLTPKRTDTQHPPKKLDGATEARIIAIACSTPPEGQSSWTLRLIADKAVELNIVDSICRESVRKVLKKRNSSSSE